MSREAWGRWGPDDEIGALNTIGEAERLAALSLVSQGRVISLAQALDSRTPVAPHRLGIGHFMDRDGGDYAAGARRRSGFQVSEDTILFPAHSGTHIDALCHVWYEGQIYNGFGQEEIRSTGAGRCGVQVMPPIVTRGVLLDVAGDDATSLSAGEQITAADIEALCKRQELHLGPGDVALIRTGWYERVEELGRSFFDGEPGIELSAAEWLAEQGVAAIGADNYAIEAIPFAEGSWFPVHQRLLRDFGVPLVEGLLLGELAAIGRKEFLFCSAALPLQGATGSPLHPFAVL